MTQFRRGLVVGKFAPLHRGHEYLIAYARARCDALVVVSYSKPEFTGSEPERRRAWLAELFPDVRCLVVDDALLAELASPAIELHTLPDNAAPENVHRRFVGRLCLELGGGSVDAVFTSEAYGPGFAAELTAMFGTRVEHVEVDRSRSIVPISASAVRGDVHACARFLSPAVYGSFVGRVCVLGGESSGKSTLAKELARRHASVHVPEYGRELWERKGGALEYGDLLAIGRRQLELERAAARGARRWLFCDTSPLTTLFYCREMFGSAEPELERLASAGYALTVLAAPDFPFVQDGTRRDAEFRQRQHDWYVAELERRRVPYVLACGSLSERVEQVSRELESAAASM